LGFDRGVKLRAKIIFGLILTVTAVFLALIWREGSSRRAVEAYKQQLRNRGEKLTVSELLPIPPARSLEGARTFTNAMNLLYSSSNYSGLPLESQANRNALSNLQTVLKFPILYFDLDYSKGWELPLPHIGMLKSAEQLASSCAVSALHEGRFSDAWTNLQIAVGLVRRYQTEPLAISHRVRVIMAQTAISTTWQFLQSGQFIDAQLAELQSDFQAVEFFDATKTAFIMERPFDIEGLRFARESYNQMMRMGVTSPGPATISSGFFSGLAQPFKELYNRFRFWSWKSSWSYDEELQSLQRSDAILETINRTELSGAFAPALKELDANLARIDSLHATAAPHFMFGGLGIESWRIKSLLRGADAEVDRRLVITAIALKRYQIRHGKYPMDLEALVPEFLPQVPLDFMDGKLLRYKTSPDGNFLLYSVGEDGEVNAGVSKSTEPENKGYRSRRKARGVVWPRPAIEEEIADYYNKLTNPETNQILSNGRHTETNVPENVIGAGK
jgi:hypothetical protein